MGFNLKKAKIEHGHYDDLLDQERDEKGHESPDGGNYDRNLSENRKDKEETDIWEKTLSKHHTEDSDTPRVTEARFEDAEKRDDRTHKTNTLPINELAEEAQRARLKARGESGVDESHFQQYKKEDLNLSQSNFARLDKINRQMDKLWMSSSWSRLTTAEKRTMRQLMEERNKIVRS